MGNPLIDSSGINTPRDGSLLANTPGPYRASDRGDGEAHTLRDVKLLKSSKEPSATAAAPETASLSTHLSTSLFWMAVLTIGIMSAYGLLRNLIQPGKGTLLTNIEDVIFTIVAALAGTCFALHKQRILAQRLLRETLEREKVDDKLAVLSRAVEQTQDMVIFTDRNGVLSHVNPAFEKQTGFTREEVIGKRMSLIKSGKQDQAFYEELWKTILSGQAYRGVLINKRKNGEFFYSEEMIAPVRDHEGIITNFIATARDISEQIRLQESLGRRQQALASVYQLATDENVSLDKVCAKAVWILADLLGLSHVIVQQVVAGSARTIAALAHGNPAAGDAGLQQSPFSTVEPASCHVRGSLRQIYPDNEFFIKHDLNTLISVPLILNGSGLVGRIIAMDAAERIISDDDIRLVEIVGSYVAHEIGRAGMEAQLNQEREMRLLGQVASGIAHEVRNPLSAILSITEAVCRDLRDKPEYELHLTHIRTQVNRLSMLMQDLLNLGKPLNKGIPQRISLPAACEGAINVWLQYGPPHRHCNFLIRPENGYKLEIVGDGGKLQQVLVNLLENAAQHSPEGGEIRLVLEAQEKTVQIRVTDQGSGIPEQNLNRIFEPFFTTRANGTGLGLTVVKKIVEHLGGEIVVRNNYPPPGCTVQVSFPAAPAE